MAASWTLSRFSGRAMLVGMSWLQVAVHWFDYSIGIMVLSVQVLVWRV
jgi:hypothetical protein